MAASGLLLNPAEVDAVYSPVNFHGAMPAVQAIQIYLATLGTNSSVIPMRVLSSDTIASVKMRIQAYKGFYTKQQRLVYGGRELTRDDRLIKDYGVSNGEVLHLVLRLSELVDVTVKTADGREYLFKVERSRCVRDLKKRISDKEGGLALDQQQLVLRGKNLEDRRLIDDLSLQDDAAVHLVVRRTAKLRTRCVGKEVELSVTADEIDFIRESLVSVVVEELPPSLSPPEDAGLVSHAQQHLQALVSSKLNYEGRLVDRTEIRQEHVTEYLAGILEPASSILRFDIPDVLVDMLAQAKAGLQGGHSPVLSSEGSGGAYFLMSPYGFDSVAIFKPVDEEPMAVNNPRGLCEASRGEGLKKGTRVGEGAMREVAAYILDHPTGGRRSVVGKDRQGFSGVPPTMMVRCSHKAFNYSAENWNLPRKSKLGSLQQFVPAFSNCEDMGPASFPVDEVHKIAVLDMRLANTDRNGGNILVCKDRDNAALKLVPIDHGYCLPEKFEDCTFEWLYWPQAHVPFQTSTLKYIATLDAEQDIAILRQHGWSLRSACSRVFRIATMLLKKGAAAGLTPFAIGSMMCRESLNYKSTIEIMLEEAEEVVLPVSSDREFMGALSDIMDQHIRRVK